LDHDLAYRGMESGALQVTDLYSTDAEIAYYGLRVLEDDLGYFPEYDAVLLYRAELDGRAPEVVAAFGRLEGRISEKKMVELNAQAKLQRVPEPQVAAAFLERELGLAVTVRGDSLLTTLWLHTREHLFLVGLSLFAAILVAVPLGVLVARRPRLGQGVLALAGIIQTVPSLALLVFMIPLLGIGSRPAIVALFLYSLLPIIRNTAAGLSGIPPEVRESAEALGLPSGARLRLVELPMASPSILAGIQTSAVINVGTATLGALIGAGGYGQPILTGIRLDDTGLILQGAVPAAVLALLVSGLFGLVSRLVVPRGLRL
jgi:osmoprotectant transport system permease protein